MMSGRWSAIPVAVGPVQSSPPLLRHTAHCCNHSGVVGHAGTGRHHACYCTPYGSSSTAPSSPPGDAPVNCYASVGGTRKIRIITLTRVRVLNTFKYNGKAQRDSGASETLAKLKLLYAEYQKSLNEYGVRPAPLPDDIDISDFMDWLEDEFKVLGGNPKNSDDYPNTSESS
jgi:hypothetical protein